MAAPRGFWRSLEFASPCTCILLTLATGAMSQEYGSRQQEQHTQCMSICTSSAAAMNLSGPTVQEVDCKGELMLANTPEESSNLMGPVAGPSR